MEILISLLLVIGAFFVLVAALGVHRLKDVYSRLHATSKSGTLGLIAVLVASVLYFEGVGAHSTKQLLTIAFVFLTVPAGTHILCRAAFAQGYKMWKPHAEITAEERQIIAEIRESVQVTGRGQESDL